MITASCARKVGRLSEAEILYKESFQLAKQGIHDDTHADLHTRYGWLLLTRKDASASSFADRAIALAPGAVIQGAAYHLHGIVAVEINHTSGLEDFARAMCLTRNQRRSKYGRRVFYAALKASPCI